MFWTNKLFIVNFVVNKVLIYCQVLKFLLQWITFAPYMILSKYICFMNKMTMIICDLNFSNIFITTTYNDTSYKSN
jgi:hypothetical protein